MQKSDTQGLLDLLLDAIFRILTTFGTACGRMRGGLAMVLSPMSGFCGEVEVVVVVVVVVEVEGLA